ncbi:MAG: hypothetical protein WEB53_01035 [Akkermansiaceae bacterium]
MNSLRSILLSRISPVLCLFAGTLTTGAADPANPLGDAFPVTISINAGEALGEIKPIWRFFGADEPNYAYLREGKDLLGELGRLSPQQVFFRTHHLLTSGDGVYCRNMGSPVPILPEQYAKLKHAGQLAALDGTQPLELTAGESKVNFNLPRQGVSLLVIERK